MGRLSDRSVKTVGEGRHGDGDGLQLIVSASCRRKWVLRYQLNGVRRDMGLLRRINVAQRRNCKRRAATVARAVDKIGRPLKQYDLCAKHTEFVIRREVQRGREVREWRASGRT